MASYAFRDITARDASDSYKSAEEVKFNGEWLYQVVPGFKTLNVTGRELLPVDVSTYDVGPNTYYRDRKYPPRTIKVKYQIIAEDDEAFRTAYNLLNYYLAPEEAKLAFNDDPNKYFIATKASNSEVEAGRNCVTGEISFYCTDPLKYASSAKSFDISSVTVSDDDGNSETKRVFAIENQGTVAVPISYDVTIGKTGSTKECGFVGFISPEGDVLQYGLVEEEDKEKKTKSMFAMSNDDADTMAAEMRAEDLSGSPYHVTGSMASRTMTGLTDKILRPSMGTHETAWHGPCRSMLFSDVYDASISADLSPVKNVAVRATVVFETSLESALCLLRMTLNNEQDQAVAQLLLIKNKKGALDAFARMIIGDVILPDTIPFVMSPAKSPFSRSEGGGDIRIQKSGAKFSFLVGETEYSTDFSKQKNGTNLKNTKIASVTVQMCQKGTEKYGMSGVIKMSARLDNVPYWSNVPNRFKYKDVIHVNGARARMTVNGKARNGDEVIGSKYFKAEPGSFPVQVVQSDWAADVTGTATIREAWL